MVSFPWVPREQTESALTGLEFPNLPASHARLEAQGWGVAPQVSQVPPSSRLSAACREEPPNWSSRSLPGQTEVQEAGAWVAGEKSGEQEAGV